MVHNEMGGVPWLCMATPSGLYSLINCDRKRKWLEKVADLGGRITADLGRRLGRVGRDRCRPTRRLKKHTTTVRCRPTSPSVSLAPREAGHQTVVNILLHKGFRDAALEVRSDADLRRPVYLWHRGKLDTKPTAETHLSGDYDVQKRAVCAPNYPM